MTYARQALLLTMMLVLAGCGVTRSSGYRVDLDGTITLPETADPQQVTAVLTYEEPRLHFWTFDDRMVRFSGTYRPPEHRRPAQWVTRPLEVDGDEILVDLQIEVYRYSNYTPVIQVEGAGIGKRGRARISFVAQQWGDAAGRIQAAAYTDFVIDLPAAHADGEPRYYVKPSRVEHAESR